MQVNAINFNIVSSNLGINRAKTRFYNKQDENNNTADIKARNIVYKIDNDKLNINIPYMTAQIIDKTPKDPLNMSDPANFKFRMYDAELQIGDIGLSSYMREQLQNDPKGKLSDLRIVCVSGNRLRFEGKMKIGFLNVPFKLDGSIKAVPGNLLKFTPDKINIYGISVKKFMDTFGLEIGNIAKISDSGGRFFSLGDSIYMVPNKFTSEPSLEGKVSDVKTEGGNLSIIYSQNSEGKMPSIFNKDSSNYVKLVSHNNLLFEGIRLKDADVILNDKTPNTPLDFTDSNERLQKVNSGEIGISQPVLEKMVVSQMGSNNPIKNLQVNLKPGHTEIKGKYWGIFPISVSMFFDKSPNGELMLTPKKAELLGFIPLPKSLIKKTLQESLNGTVYGDGVTVPMSDIELSPLKQVINRANELILRM